MIPVTGSPPEETRYQRRPLARALPQHLDEWPRVVAGDTPPDLRPPVVFEAFPEDVSRSGVDDRDAEAVRRDGLGDDVVDVLVGEAVPDDEEVGAAGGE